MEILLNDVPIAVLMGIIGALVFTAIGVVSGTDETATLAPLTLLVVLLGTPAAGVLTFFMAGAIAKHLTHAIPTTLLGIPGDTMAVPLLREAGLLRQLGVPHIALRKAISGGVIAAFIAVPLAVFFAFVLSPFSDQVQAAAPYVFLVAAVGIAYSSAGRWGAVAALVPFTVLIVGLRAVTTAYERPLSISFFLGIAIGPLILDLVRTLSPETRREMTRAAPRTVWLAPDVKGWSGYFPNPFTILDKGQVGYVAATAGVTSATFVFSPVATAVLAGEIVGNRVRQGYRRLTSVIAARNGTTESTYIAEALIPLIAFGLPLSPVAAGPAAPLFNAAPRFNTDPAVGEVVNLSTLLSSAEFLWYGLLSVVLAAAIAYPFAMHNARRAAAFVVNRLSHEAIIGTFTGLILVVSVWEGGILGLFVTLTVGLVGGLLSRAVKMHAGVQFMGFYLAVLTVPTLTALFS